jgi:hypothetical protein
MKRASSPGISGEATLLDMRDMDSSGLTNASLGVAHVRNGSRTNTGSYFDVGTSGGTGGAYGVQIQREGFAHGFQIPTGVSGVIGRSAPSWSIPFWRDVSQLPASYTTRRRILIEGTLKRANNAANTAFALVVARAHNQLYTAITAGGQCGVQVISSPLFNGGNWTPQYQLVRQGAVVSGSDSGVPGTNPARIEIEWSEIGPSISVRINGIVCLSLTGIANMPSPADLGPIYPTTVSGTGTQMSTHLMAVGLGPAGYEMAYDLRYRMFET